MSGQQTPGIIKVQIGSQQGGSVRSIAYGGLNSLRTIKDIDFTGLEDGFSFVYDANTNIFIVKDVESIARDSLDLAHKNYNEIIALRTENEIANVNMKNYVDENINSISSGISTEFIELTSQTNHNPIVKRNTDEIYITSGDWILIDSFDKTLYRSAKYQFQISGFFGYHTFDYNVIYDNISIKEQINNDFYTQAPLVEVLTELNGDNVNTYFNATATPLNVIFVKEVFARRDINANSVEWDLTLDPLMEMDLMYSDAVYDFAN